MGPSFVRGNYSDLYGSTMLPALEYIFWSEIDRHPQLRDSLFRKESTDNQIWQSTEMHDMPLFVEVAEGTDYSYSRPKQGANKTLTMTKYGMGFSISEEAVADGRFNQIQNALKKLARSALETQEINAMNVFNNSFSSTLTADGLALLHSAHTLPSGLTYRNRISVDADLSASSLDTALTDFETVFIGDSGMIYKMVPKKLIVHSSQRRYAKELVGSDLKPDTADNNMNSLKGEGLEVVASPHLTDLDAFWLEAAPEETGLVIVEREGISTKAAPEAVGWGSDSLFYKSKFREQVGALHGYGIYGSQGA